MVERCKQVPENSSFVDSRKQDLMLESELHRHASRASLQGIRSSQPQASICSDVSRKSLTDISLAEHLSVGYFSLSKYLTVLDEMSILLMFIPLQDLLAP
jgi:hypothetical protein